MEELAKKIRGLTGEVEGPEGFDRACKELREAAKTLAGLAIEQFDEKARYLALRVCDDLAEFLNYLDD